MKPKQFSEKMIANIKAEAYDRGLRAGKKEAKKQFVRQFMQVFGLCDHDQCIVNDKCDTCGAYPV